MYVEVSDKSMLDALKSSAVVEGKEDAIFSWLLPLQTLSFSKSLSVVDTDSRLPRGCVVAAVTDKCKLHTDLKVATRL